MSSVPRPPSRPPTRPAAGPPGPTGAPPRRASQTPPPEDVVTKQTLVGAVVLTALLTTIIAAFVVAGVIEKGGEGPRGPTGSQGETGKDGPRGERGRTSDAVQPAALAKAIKDDPGQFSDAANEALGLDLSQADPLSNSPDDGSSSSSGDLEGDVQSLRDDVQSVCEALRSGGSVDTNDLPC